MLDEFEKLLQTLNTAPTFKQMPRLTLEDKGINGPTSAHVIEEIHTPFNFSYITLTTGSSAFQNVVGVTKFEIADRIEASVNALKLCGVKKGDRVLFCYPPLVNVFPKQTLINYGLTWGFLYRSSREALIVDLCKQNYNVIIGESSFIRATLTDMSKLGLTQHLQKNLIFITAGTPFDLSLLDEIKQLDNASVHDLYGCQEFGWITVNGIPLRRDIKLIPHDDFFDLFVGGLPTGDCFAVTDTGHILNSDGKIITYSRKRTDYEYEVTVLETKVSRETIQKAAKTIIRIKAKIVHVSPDLKDNSDKTVLSVKTHFGDKTFIIDDHTDLFDSIVKAQMDYQKTAKSDVTWIKQR